MKELLQLLISFARVGLLTFGGGYAMLPMLKSEIVERQGWASEEELLDWFAVSQCTPGVIAVNVATFVGCKRRGALGGVAATVGVVLPSFVIIVVLAAFINNFADNRYVAAALGGIRVCVCVLILNSVVKMLKKAVKDFVAAGLFLLILAGAVLLDISPVLLVLFAGAAGVAIQSLRAKKQ